MFPKYMWSVPASFALIPFSQQHPLDHLSLFPSIFVLRKIIFQKVKGVIWVIRKQEKSQHELTRGVHFFTLFSWDSSYYVFDLLKWVRQHWECSVCNISLSHNDLTMLILWLSLFNMINLNMIILLIIS